MNSQSNTASLEGQGAVEAVLRPTQPFYWSVRRELWENRSVYLAPLAVAAVFLLGYLISTIHLADRMRAASSLNPMQRQMLIEQPYTYAELLIMAAGFIVGVFYSLDALHGERRDRSILFWKSLPVSDTTAVLAKASIPIAIIPLVTFAVTAATQLIMLLISSAALAGTGLNAMLWPHLPLIHMWLVLLYHLVTAHGLWYAPVYAWLLLVSAWARRATFLWAGLPVLAMSVLEKIGFNSWHFALMLQSRLTGGSGAAATPGGSPMDQMMPVDPGKFLSSPGLWIGLLVTVGFLAAAVRIRRYRDPS